MSTVAAPRPSRQPRRNRGESPVPERHLRVVEPPRHRIGRRVLTLFFLFGFGAILFATVVFHVSLITGQQRIDRLDRQAQEAQQTYDRLRVEVDTLSAPRRVVARARALGMVDAHDRTWLAPGETTITNGPDQSMPGMRDYLDVKPYLQGAP